MYLSNVLFCFSESLHKDVFVLKYDPRVRVLWKNIGKRKLVHLNYNEKNEGYKIFIFTILHPSTATGMDCVNKVPDSRIKSYIY